MALIVFQLLHRYKTRKMRLMPQIVNLVPEPSGVLKDPKSSFVQVFQWVHMKVKKMSHRCCYAWHCLIYYHLLIYGHTGPVLKLFQPCFQNWPISSREARKKIPFKCAKLLTKIVIKSQGISPIDIKTVSWTLDKCNSPKWPCIFLCDNPTSVRGGGYIRSSALKVDFLWNWNALRKEAWYTCKYKRGLIGVRLNQMKLNFESCNTDVLGEIKINGARQD